MKKVSENRRIIFLTKEMKFIFSNLLNEGTEGSSASKEKYKKLIERIERMSKIVCIALIISFLGLMVPALFVTIANYFMCDLADKTFHLPFPML